MATSARADKQIAYDRRRAGELALSDFAEYVEQQQKLRRPGGTAAGDAAEDHDELDIIESLGLADDSQPNSALKDLLLGPREENGPRLRELLLSRIKEGRGETLFEVGVDNNNAESMEFTKEEYEQAMEAVRTAAAEVRAAVTVLITSNLGADGGEPTDGKGVTSTVLIRQKPESLEGLLEIRVAVVGNGRYHALLSIGAKIIDCVNSSRCGEVNYAGGPNKKYT